MHKNTVCANMLHLLSGTSSLPYFVNLIPVYSSDSPLPAPVTSSCCGVDSPLSSSITSPSIALSFPAQNLPFHKSFHRRLSSSFRTDLLGLFTCTVSSYRIVSALWAQAIASMPASIRNIINNTITLRMKLCI